jgi:hypothetical protein
MATYKDQIEFEGTVALARAAHQESLKSAQSNFEARRDEAQRAAQDRLVAARQAVADVGDDAAREALNRAFDQPDWSLEARRQHDTEVQAADRALNEALEAARRKLLAA